LRHLAISSLPLEFLNLLNDGDLSAHAKAGRMNPRLARHGSVCPRVKAERIDRLIALLWVSDNCGNEEIVSGQNPMQS
jgi:hypothetical protein